MSAFGGKADIGRTLRNVRFLTQSGDFFRLFQLRGAVLVVANGDAVCLADVASIGGHPPPLFRHH
jgi:hypothetical protein